MAVFAKRSGATPSSSAKVNAQAEPFSAVTSLVEDSSAQVQALAENVRESFSAVTSVVEDLKETSLLDEFDLDEAPPDWHWSRRQLHDVLKKGETFTGCVVLLNFIFIIIETDLNVKDESTPLWLVVFNVIFVVFYTVELATRFYVQRQLFWRFGSNIFDFVIVVLAITGEVLANSKGMDNVAMMRIIRIVRVLRAIRVMESFHELWCLIRDAIACLRTLGWAFVLIALILSMWSVFAVEFLHDLAKDLPDCSYCETAFSSVLNAGLTFFGMVCFGHGWDNLALPLMNQHPWSAVIFMGVIFTVMFGLLNILIAAMCENAAAGRQMDLDEIVKQNEATKKQEILQLYELCQKLDCNKDGTITANEMRASMDDVPEISNILKTMNIEKDELDMVLHVLDVDGTGEVTYSEFASQLWKMQNANLHSLLMMVKHYVHTIWLNVKDLRRCDVRPAETNSETRIPVGSKENRHQYIEVAPRQVSETDLSVRKPDFCTSGTNDQRTDHQMYHSSEVAEAEAKFEIPTMSEFSTPGAVDVSPSGTHHDEHGCSRDLVQKSQCQTNGNVMHKDVSGIKASSQHIPSTYQGG